MILTDGFHLISDTSLAELHKFARKIKLKPEWFQDHPRHPHYDLTTHRAVYRAVEAGAKVVSKKELAKAVTHGNDD